MLNPSKDVQVWSNDPTGEVDRGTNRRDLVIYEWTAQGIPTTKYCLIEFDLSNIPINSKIDSAFISFYYDSGSIDPGHSTEAGSNEFYIYRLLGEWEETVSWNDVPSYSESNKVLVAASNNSDQNYIDINVTDLVRDIIDGPDPNYGFLLKLRFTEYYRSVIIASSEHPNAELHPVLRIVRPNEVVFPDSPICDCSDFNISPSLASDNITFNLNEDLLSRKEISIFNSLGQLVEHKKLASSKLEIDVSNYADGCYFITFSCKEKRALKFIVSKI
jgi:hypothetical protein